ncbi:MAG: (2Fe-2S)-binding protein, partial [Burkholderiaceae bacterium]
RRFGQALLNGRATPPLAVAPRAPQVCNCFDVSRTQIVEALATCAGNADARLALLQQRLSCGTQCGSCLPAVRNLIGAHPHPGPPAGHRLGSMAMVASKQ